MKKTLKKPGRRKGDIGPRALPPLHPATIFALAVHRMKTKDGFAEAVFGARVHPVLADLVWNARCARDCANDQESHPDARAWAAEDEKHISNICRIAMSQADAALFEQMAYCLNRLPSGTARNFPVRATILRAYHETWIEGRPPSASMVTECANHMTKELLTVSRVAKELDRMNLPRSTSKN